MPYQPSPPPAVFGASSVRGSGNAKWPARIIELHGIVKNYGRICALHKVSMVIGQGITGLLGPNGAGKTTLIKVLLGLVRITAGSGAVLGYDLMRSARLIRQNVGFMPEDDCYISGLSGVEMVQFAARLSGYPRLESLRRAHEILDFCGVEQERYRDVDTYSTGMRQKVKFAQAIVHDPPLLILDEPTAGLDPDERVAMLHRVQTLTQRAGKTVLLSTHILPDVRAICDTVAILAEGEVRVVDSLDKLSQPASPAIHIRMTGDAAPLIARITAGGGVVTANEDGSWRVELGGTDAAQYLWQWAEETGVGIRSLVPSRNSLEQISWTLCEESAVPIHDVGYRGWDRAVGQPWLRWVVIASAGMRLVWKNHWLRRMLFFAWLPAAGLGIAIFVYEQSFERRELRNAIPFLLEQLPQSEVALGAWYLDAGQARHEVWSLLLMTYFRYPQAVLIVLLIGMIAPPLISQDFRSRAFLLYFSRPISPLEYVWGKTAVIWGYLATVTTFPAMMLYVVGVLLSPSINVVFDTWDIPLRILAASAVLLIPTTSLALFFSSLTNESRYAGFAWFAVWGLGWAAYGYLQVLSLGRRWSMISLYHVLGYVEAWVFGLSSDPNEVTAAATLLVFVTVLPLIVLLARVAAPMRV